MAHLTDSDGMSENGDGWFFAQKFWLPENVTWKHLRSDAGNNYPKFEDLWIPIPLAVGLVFLRFCLDRLVFHPLGKHYGLKPRRENLVVPNDTLEAVYRSYRGRKINDKEFIGLAKRTDMEVRQVERWWRRRTFMDKPSTLAKFSESGWRFFCYVSSIVIGFYVLWDKPWFGDVMHCWYNYPQHQLTSGIWWYYMLSSALYYSIMFSQFSDAHRKDFWQMFIHHVTTIFLLGFSWTINMVRIGTLVLLVHDTADPFLEIAKMAKYAKFETICLWLFGIFSFMFLLTRLYIYPLYVLRSALYDANKVFPMFPAQYIFYIMLILLLVLHLFWSYLLFKAIYRAAFHKEVSDVRSSSSASSSSCDSADDEQQQNDGAAGDATTTIKNSINSRKSTTLTSSTTTNNRQKGENNYNLISNLVTATP